MGWWVPGIYIGRYLVTFLVKRALGETEKFCGVVWCGGLECGVGRVVWCGRAKEMMASGA
jgi:hypothetical protein